jgi:sulfur-oxidizing protein SoxZ
MSNYRLSVPAQVKRGEDFAVRIIIQHPMETGFRLDAAGKPYPRNLINEIVCKLGGEEVLRIELSSGITANPYFEFHARAEQSGPLTIEWRDDAEVRASASTTVQVSG